MLLYIIFYNIISRIICISFLIRETPPRNRTGKTGKRERAGQYQHDTAQDAQKCPLFHNNTPLPLLFYAIIQHNILIFYYTVYLKTRIGLRRFLWRNRETRFFSSLPIPG
jgi:hypothetical protein